MSTTPATTSFSTLSLHDALPIFLAIPFFSMRLGSADSGSDPANTTTRKAYDLLAKGFGPGYNGPLQLVSPRSEEHTSELQSHVNIVCRLLLEKKKNISLALTAQA